jgi:hypothetical protein
MFDADVGALVAGGDSAGAADWAVADDVALELLLCEHAVASTAIEPAVSMRKNACMIVLLRRLHCRIAGGFLRLRGYEP